MHTVRTFITVEREYRQIHGMTQYPRRIQGYGFRISCRLYRFCITTNACAPIPLQWIPGPIFAYRSVIRSVKLAKIGRGDEARAHRDILIEGVCNFVNGKTLMLIIVLSQIKYCQTKINKEKNVSTTPSV